MIENATVKRSLALLVVFCLISLMSVPLAASDGGPLFKEGTLTLRQNRQFADVEVNDNSQTMKLFVSVASLEPGENLKIVVPLRTRPSNVQCNKTVDEEFLENIEFDLLRGLHEKQTGGLGQLCKEFNSKLGILSLTELVGIFGVAEFYSMGMGGVVPTEHYAFEGTSVDIYSIDSAETLENLLQSLNLDISENILSALSNYYNHYVAVINTETKPPIPQYEFETLQAEAPELISTFRSYVGNHPKIVVYDLWGQQLGYGDLELHQMAESIENSVLRQYFDHLVAGTYGLGTSEGFVVSLEMPLDNGKAYFPLGTSPAWGTVSQIKVVFSCPDNKNMNFNREGMDAFHDGKHYYIWEFSDESPSYDLTGEIQDGNVWEKFTHGFSTWIYDAAPFLSALTILLIFVLAWFLPLLFCVKLLNWGHVGRKISKLDTFFISVLGVCLSMAISLPLAMLVVGWLSYRVLRLKRSEVHHMRLTLAACLAIFAAGISAFTLVMAKVALIFDIYQGWISQLFLICGILGFSFGLSAGVLILKRKGHWLAMVGMLVTAATAVSFFFLKDGWWIYGLIVAVPAFFSALLLEKEYRLIRSKLTKIV